MRHLLKATVIVGVIAAMLPAIAQDEGPPVPVEKAAYHWPVFSNEYIMLLRVVMTPGKGSNYHVHSLDQISVLVGAGANAGQVYGKERVAPKAGKRGNVSFTPYSKKGPFTHRSTNMGTGPVRQYRGCAPEAWPGGLQAAGARGFGLHADFR